VALNEGVASPNQLANRFGEPLPNVSYHVRILLDLECIELVETAQRRGAIEHFYRAVMLPFFSDEDWRILPPSARQAISADTVRQIIDDTARALADGSFDGRDDRHLSRTVLRLDEEAWKELNGLLASALERASELEAETARRRDGHGAEDTFETNLVVIHSPRAAGSDEEPASPE